MYTTILTLHKRGNSQRQIARSTGHDNYQAIGFATWLLPQSLHL